ncbi:hypothetical protein [Spirosoma sp. 209]|uniref:hypothetical protein n=1 Tax=Spirosoma sp. 209 TaxID=1955701 RepID=UPI00098D3135|nr:hypothetical protein [Spirosoma sp. 209]
MQTTAPKVTVTRSAPDPNELDALLDRLKGLLAIDFLSHDPRLQQCLSSARRQIEKHTGVLVDAGQVEVFWRECYDYVELPYGPVTGTITATNGAGTALTLPALGTGFVTLTGDYTDGLKLSYAAGYTPDTLPDDLAEAILRLAANLFDDGVRNWKSLARAHSRYSWAI